MSSSSLLTRLHVRFQKIHEQHRKTYLRNVLNEPTLELHLPVFIEPLSGLKVGKRVAINAFVHVWANETVTIGDDSMIASHVQITTSTHNYRVRPYREHRQDAPVSIGRNVWIGSGAIVLPGITIGDHSVIGAGSVVTRDVPAGCVVAGVPARIVRSL